MTKVYRENVIEHLKELADAEFQQRAWLGKIPNIVSSYEEVVCGLFDDSGLGDALEAEELYPVFDPDTDAVLRRLSAEVLKIRSQDPRLILNDPQLVNIRGLAERSLQMISSNYPRLLE
jgi:hypothetical protein